MMETVDGQPYLTKYVDQPTRTDYAPVIRWAEVLLLNRAEALVRAGNTVTQQAVDLLNAVRIRSFATGAYALGDFASAAAFYDAVLLRGTWNSWVKGSRSMDLMRLSLTIPGKTSDAGFGTVSAIPSTSAVVFLAYSGQ
ncbi:MAG: RagB/SusD family nutrient uptake outer membrane protein [Bacteroidales bacterium]|nr:RagB/SusD family nutrient uptake outer membrane protein [Bacteroidales bacterium]